MYFELAGPIISIEVIARGSGIRNLKLIMKRYGRGRWRKLKGTAQVRLQNGNIRHAEVHWYEAHGIGKRGMKIKRLLD